MKRILATTAILALSAGFASAEVTLSGDARMGIIGGDGVDTAFTSRARVKFSMSGETDGGLAFGASFRADNAKEISDTDTTCVQVPDGPDADLELDLECTSTTTTSGGANAGTAGEVHISGAFGKLSMGDVDGAAQAAVGQVSGVGLTGLGDLNEVSYIASGGNTIPGGGAMGDPSALYEYSAGSFTGYISVTNPGTVSADGMAIGAKYSAGDFTFAAGYEQTDDGIISDTNLVLGASATFGAVTGKVIWSSIDATPGIDQDQLAVSVDYVADALTVTAFYKDVKTPAATYPGSDAYGIGAAYDLGGGASVVGGYAVNTTTDSSAFDLGLSFSF